MKEMIPQSAYLHIPFCVKKCSYCDFVSFANQSEKMEAYLLSILREIELTKDAFPNHEPLSTIYFGGGTPTTYAPEQLALILRALHSAFGIVPDAEITLEMNPGTVDASSLLLLKESGFNRVSIGVQSFSDRLLSVLGRIHTSREAESAIQEARSAGFGNINCDLMIGLPEQSFDDAMTSVQRLIDLKVPHISFYSLSLEEGTPFFDQYNKREDLLPTPELEREMYHGMLAVLKRNGYEHYEISNCALPGYRSRHNTIYWKALPYYGFGCGAHAFLQGDRFGKITDLNRYIKSMRSDGMLTDIMEETVTIDEAESEREFMLLGFRLTEGVAEEEFMDRFGMPMTDVFSKELEELLNKKLILRDNGHFFLSKRGIDLANEVFRSFVK